jgi:hypothetical protein
MAKKSKGKSAAIDGSSSLEQQQARGTSTAIPSTSNALESSTASTSSVAPDVSTQHKEVRAVVSSTSGEEVEELPEIQVNKWSLHDLKTACDDAVKQVGISMPSQCSYQHHS